jgi:hypothetical protein
MIEPRHAVSLLKEGLSCGVALLAPSCEGRLSTPLAQVCGELLCRFIFARWLSKQSFKVVDWNHALLSSQFLEGRRGGAIR